VIVIVVFVVLGLGGVVLDHFSAVRLQRPSPLRGSSRETCTWSDLILQTRTEQATSASRTPLRSNTPRVLPAPSKLFFPICPPLQAEPTPESRRDDFGPGFGRLLQERTVLVSACVVVVLIVTVMTDPPEHASPASQISEDRTAVQQINTDIAPCISIPFMILAVTVAVVPLQAMAKHEVRAKEFVARPCIEDTSPQGVEASIAA
jgi:hypothetical protein